MRSAMCAASQLPGTGPLMWMMPLHLHVNQKSDYDMMMIYNFKESNLTKVLLICDFISYQNRTEQSITLLKTIHLRPLIGGVRDLFSY